MMTARARTVVTTTLAAAATTAAALAAAFPAAGAAQDASALEEAKVESRRLMAEFVADDPTPGVSVAVMVGDSLVWAEGFGLASVEHEVPVTPETRFRIGSISKSLTSVAVALLVQRGELDLDAPVQAYVPSFPEKAHPVTTRQLGGHLSGIPHYDDADMLNRVHYPSVTEALAKFRDRPLLFRPGERFEYSSFGFNLISAVVEGASGRPFLDFMEDEVLEPLGMHDTGPDDPRAIVPDRTGFYAATEDGELRHAPWVDNSDVWAGGGYLSTPTDLVTFGAALLRGELLEPISRELLWTSMRTADGTETGYGFGWSIDAEEDGSRVYHHEGAHFGARAMLALFPEDDVVVAITANMSRSEATGLGGPIAEVFRAAAQARRDRRDRPPGGP